MTRFCRLVLAVWLVAMGCRSRPEATPPDKTNSTPDTLTVAMREPGSIDPAFLNGTNDFQIASNIYQGLYRYNARQGRAEPALATVQRKDEDHRVWFFKLNPDARYEDGTPIRADDFRFAWQRILSPDTASPGADALFVLKRGREMAGGKDVPFAVTVLAPDQLRVELDAPQPFLPEILASPRFAPLPERAFEQSRDDLHVQGLKLASGPYRVAAWKPRESMTLEPNPHYPFPDDQPPFQSITLRFSGSEETALTWWDAGQVDIVQGLVPYQKHLLLRGKYPGALLSQPMHSVFYLFLSQKERRLSDPSVRRALFSTIDRQSLVHDVLGGGQIPALAFVPPTYAAATGFDPEPCTTMPVAKAKATIEAARDALTGTEMMCNASETLRAIMETIQQSFKRRLDLFLAIRMIEWGSYLELLKQGDFALARMSLSGGADPIDFFENFTAQSSNNFGAYRNPEYDGLVEAMRHAGDAEDRADLMQRAHTILCRELPALPVYFSTQVYLVKEPLRPHFAPTPDGIIHYQALR